MLINQELLRTFVDAAETETFGKAAARRHVTKSAISQQIKTLEAQLGVLLFERIGRHARLTEQGRELARVLRRELDVIDDALDAVVSGQREVSGEIRIGAPRPFARAWLRSRLAGLLRAHPRLLATVLFGTPTELEERLVARDLDLAILVRPAASPAVAATRIFTERFEAYGAPSYLRAHGVMKSAADLSRFAWIVYDDDLPMHAAWWRAHIGANAPMPAPVCKIASLDEMLALAIAGVGLVVLPDYFAGDALAARQLAALPTPAPRPRAGGATNGIELAWRKNAVLTARFAAAKGALLAGPDQ
jgi:DNA-binding transcriptional LysR family regulator